MEAMHNSEWHTRKFTAPAALVNGQIMELPDRQLGIVPGAGAGVPSGDVAAAQTADKFWMAKIVGVVLLEGQEAYFVPGSNAVSFYAPGRRYAGVVQKDASSAATTVLVELNAPKRDYAVCLTKGQWTTTSVNQAADFTVLPGGNFKLAIDNGNEAGKVVMMSDDTLDISAGPILEARIAIFDASDNTVDINVGLASGDHATDFEAITAFAALHVDGGALDILTHSDDNVTDTAPADSTLNYVDDTWFHVMVDARVKSAVKIYVDGVQAGAALDISAYASTLKAIVHAEKTTGTAIADVRIEKLRMWRGLAA